MPQSERLRVWNGTLKKTSGGLTKNDLMKNKRGKIVSKKKSAAAKQSANNLGAWLRSKGDHFLSKGVTKENIIRKGKPGRKAFKAQKQPEKEAPSKPGDKPKNKSNIDVGNIYDQKAEQAKFAKLDITEKWRKLAKAFKKKGKTEEWTNRFLKKRFKADNPGIVWKNL